MRKHDYNSDKEFFVKMRKGNSQTKRISVVAIALCVIMVCSVVLSSCGSKATDDKLIKAGLESAARIKEAVCNETYRNMMGGTLGNENESDMVEVVNNEDVTRYKAVYEITVDPETVLGLISYRYQDYDKLSDNLQKKLLQSAYAFLSTFINSSTQGYSVLSFTTLYSDRDTIVCKALKETRILVFVFESGYPIWIIYTPEVAGTVSYSSVWIVADSAKIDSEESLIEAFQMGNIETLEVKKIR